MAELTAPPAASVREATTSIREAISIRHQAKQVTAPHTAHTGRWGSGRRDTRIPAAMADTSPARMLAHDHLTDLVTTPIWEAAAASYRTEATRWDPRIDSVRDRSHHLAVL